MRRFVGALVFLLALDGSVASENEVSGLRGNENSQEIYVQAKERFMKAQLLGEKGVVSAQIDADAEEVVSTSEEKPKDTIDSKKTETNGGEATKMKKEEKVEVRPRKTVSSEQSEHDHEKRSGSNLENKKPPGKVNKDVVFVETSQKLLPAKHVGGMAPDKRLSDDKTTDDKEEDSELKVVEEKRVPGKYGYSPSICGMSREAVEKVCNTELKICKYETQQPSGMEPFHITTTLRPNQGDCIRRCDRRYGLSEAHCLAGETCFKHVTACTKCALLTRRGCEAF